MTQQEQQPQDPQNQRIALVLQKFDDVKWYLLAITLKAIPVWLLWNYLLTSVFNGLHDINFGHAFGIVMFVNILFSNLNGYSKYQTRHLYDLKSLLFQLILNQHNQNKAILDQIGKIVPESAPKVDNTKETSYNTEESEKHL